MDVILQELGIVVGHLLEMGNNPVFVHGVAMEAAGKLVVDAALRHLLEGDDGNVQQMLVAGFDVALHHEVECAGMRKLGRSAEAAMIGVEELYRRFHHALDELRPQRPGLPGESFRAADGVHHALRGFDHVRVFFAIRLGQGQQHAAKAGTPVKVLWRKIRAREERLALGR